MSVPWALATLLALTAASLSSYPALGSKEHRRRRKHTTPLVAWRLRKYLKGGST